MISLSPPCPSPRAFMGTLTNGEAIHDAFERIARTMDIGAAAFNLLGGLIEVELSEYDFIHKVRKESLVFRRPMEIVSGHGTISRWNGEPHVHLHLALAFRDESAPYGIALIGGHAARAVAFAVEFTLTVYDGVSLHRSFHHETGLHLWHVPAFNAGQTDNQ